MPIKSDFTPSVYDVSHLGMVMGCFIKPGTIGINDLKVTYRNGDTVIGKGKCILPDGSILTVDNEGYSMYTTMTDGYIYIEDREIRCSSAPKEGSLLLAHITDGGCVDLRQRAYVYSGEGVN